MKNTYLKAGIAALVVISLLASYLVIRQYIRRNYATVMVGTIHDHHAELMSRTRQAEISREAAALTAKELSEEAMRKNAKRP